jgi:hypothetical protein
MPSSGCNNINPQLAAMAFRATLKDRMGIILPARAEK